MRSTTAHPRVRGDNGFARDIERPPVRRIPACAGTTQRRSSPRWTRTAHPRVRGDNDERGVAVSGLFGASPRARGQPLDSARRSREQRRIPACAGTTREVSDRPCEPGGASPRARGQPRVLDGEGVRQRRIPACAGTTRGPCASCTRLAAHPRVRGDNNEGITSMTIGCGAERQLQTPHDDNYISPT